MAFSSWLCINNTKNMLVKIVHPGGRVELHDKPVLAAEIMLRNPRCCVTHPHVFKQPWAIVPPETMLMLGQKFYVVPISTIRKLQRLSYRYSPVQETGNVQVPCKEDEDQQDDGTVSGCCLLMSKGTMKLPYACLGHSDDDENCNQKAREGDRCFSDDNCFMCLITRGKAKGSDDTSSEETRSSISSFRSCESKGLTRKRTKDFTRKGVKGSPKRLSSSDHWQPNLESINEE